ncbi:hypothetical protein [Deinococcus sp. PEB2-67]
MKPPSDAEVLASARPTNRQDQCLFCRSRRCYARIYTTDLKYDHVACPTHARHLDRHAALSTTVPLTIVTGTSLKRRGDLSCLVDTLQHLLRDARDTLQDAAQHTSSVRTRNRINDTLRTFRGYV